MYWVALENMKFDIDKNDRTFCERLEIDEYGRIKGGLKGFFDEDVNSLTEYLNEVKSNKVKGEKNS